MQLSDTERLQGLQRWDEYLNARLKPWGIVRETADEAETRDAVWRVGFPDDTRARIRIPDETLRLDGEGFEKLVLHLEEVDCLGQLKEVSPGGLRVHPDGELEELDPEGIERRLPDDD